MRHPAFDIGSSDAGSKQTDGDTGFLVDTASEIEADCGESWGVFWFADVPTPFDVWLGGRGKVGFDAEVADQGEVCRSDIFWSIAAAESPFHIGLSAAEPDIADEDVFEQDLVGRRDFQFEGLRRGR